MLVMLIKCHNHFLERAVIQQEVHWHHHTAMPSDNNCSTGHFGSHKAYELSHIYGKVMQHKAVPSIKQVLSTSPPSAEYMAQSWLEAPDCTFKCHRNSGARRIFTEKLSGTYRGWHMGIYPLQLEEWLQLQKQQRTYPCYLHCSLLHN